MVSVLLNCEVLCSPGRFSILYKWFLNWSGHQGTWGFRTDVLILWSKANITTCGMLSYVQYWHLVEWSSKMIHIVIDGSFWCSYHLSSFIWKIANCLLINLSTFNIKPTEKLIWWAYGSVHCHIPKYHTIKTGIKMVR